MKFRNRRHTPAGDVVYDVYGDWRPRECIGTVIGSGGRWYLDGCGATFATRWLAACEIGRW